MVASTCRYRHVALATWLHVCHVCMGQFVQSSEDQLCAVSKSAIRCEDAAEAAAAAEREARKQRQHNSNDEKWMASDPESHVRRLCACVACCRK
mmetsp:Transcript_38861/g.79480  ORF Transcript_38861/g.79480 Transcript_38861/m.79480 type:complete len:94 (-) Transcript_38861:64-345(-)